jgi:ribonuclease I
MNDITTYHLSLKRPNINSIWYINGLWPDFGDDTFPTFGKQITYKYIKDKQLLNDLEHYWYNRRQKFDSYLYRQIYTKYGSCTSQEMTEDEYFSKALELFRSLYETGIIKNINSGLTDIKFEFNTNFELITA